ncbi:MAG: outer membrane porin, OprD family [Helicobacteraceae bacterium]|nr:outer membrane porin, OprD family [Helicobacteraceae bacterium]
MVLRNLFMILPLTLSILNAIDLANNIKGDVQYYYYGIDKDNTDNSYASAVGGNVEYRSEKIYRFGILLGWTSSNILNADNAKPTRLFNNDTTEVSNINAISQANIFYQNSKTYFKFGSQKLDTPLLNSTSGRVVPWTFNAVNMLYTPYTHLHIDIGYVDTIRSNTSNIYKKDSASGKLEDGVYYLGLKESLNKHAVLTMYYYNAPKLYDSIYLQYRYSRVHKSDLYCFAVQYIRTYKNGGDSSNASLTKNNGGYDTNLIGAKVGLFYENLQLQLAMTKNFGLSGIDKAYGGIVSLYTSSMIADGTGAYKPTAYSFKSILDLGENIEAELALTKVEFDDYRGTAYNAIYAGAKYYLSQYTTAHLRYEKLFPSDTLNQHYTRFILKYKF